MAFGHWLKQFQWLFPVAMALLLDNLCCHEHSPLSYHFIDLSLLGQIIKAYSEHLYPKLNSQVLSFPCGKEYKELRYQLHSFIYIFSVPMVPILTLHGTIGSYLMTLGHLKKETFMKYVMFILEIVCCHTFLQRVGIPNKSKWMSFPDASSVSGLYFAAALTHWQSLLFLSFLYTCCMPHRVRMKKRITIWMTQIKCKCHGEH